MNGAAVMNFKLNDDFEGVQAVASYEITGEGDAGIYSGSQTMGRNFDNERGNAVLSLSYSRRGALFQGDRDFATFAQFDDGEGGLFDGGSSGIPGTSIFTGNVSNIAPSAITFDTDGSVRPFVLSGDNNDFYNYAPVNYIQIPQERFQATGMGSYDVGKTAEIYGQFTFSYNDVPQQLAATPIFQSGTQFSLDGNPFLTADAQRALAGNNTDLVGLGDREALVFSDGGTAFTFDDDGNVTNTCVNCVFDSTAGSDEPNGYFNTTPLIDTDGDGIADTATAFVRRRLLEVGERRSDDQFVAFQYLAGIKGEITESISYDVSYQEGRVLNSTAQRGNVSRNRFLQGLLLAEDPDNPGNVLVDADGNPSCADASSNGATSGCVPVNIFGPGNISSEAAAFLNTSVNADARYNQRIFSATLAGDVGIELPGGPIGFAAGLEYREEEFDFDPSQDLASGNIAGFNGAPAVAGSFDVYDYFGELFLPILDGAPFADKLSMELAYRYSDYSTSGGVEAYKVAGEWAPVEDLRFRASFNTAVRAPNVIELFSPQGEGFPGANDPCSASGAPEGGLSEAVRAICVATGVPNGSVGSAVIDPPSGQVRQLSGGNPNLEPDGKRKH